MKILTGTSKKIFAIIPARGGSKGVPGKNIKLLGGYPLIAYSVAAARMSKYINRVIVSTDSDEIAGIARRYGAEVPFIRPSRYAKDKSPDIEFVLHSINWFKENERAVPGYLVHLRPTTPLREPEIIDKAIRVMMADKHATSLRSGHPAPESPFKWFCRDRNGYFRSLVGNLSNDKANAARQVFPEVYIPDGYVDVLKVHYILKSGLLHGERMAGFTSPACHEVDTAGDLEFLEFELGKSGNAAYKYLKKNFKKEG